MTIPINTDNIPSLTTAQMVEVDRAMIEDFHIELIQMMENAGRNLAHLAQVRFLDGNPTGKHVVVLAGTGGNGGGAMVSARRLHNWGAKVKVVITKPNDRFTAIPAHQLDILQRIQIPILPTANIAKLTPPDLIIDGLIDYSPKDNPRGNVALLIEWANQQPAPILALDAPSGLDTTSGAIFNPTIKAMATLTLALPKAGLNADHVAPYVGELYLADISVPPALYTKPALEIQVGHLFAKSDIIRIK